MITDIVYYSFTDPITGNATKDVSFSYQKRISGELSTVEISPHEEGLSVLTKEDFYLLDTHGESETIRERRRRNLLLIENAERFSATYAAVQTGNSTVLTKQ